MANRLEILRALVEQNPSDSRTRYMLAQDLANAGEREAAVEQYQAIIAADKDYLAAYYHGGQALERLGRVEEARRLYEQGIAAAGRTGDEHTRAELQEALDAL